jgi:hypothetical protein
MAAGLGFKEFTTGDVLTAADANGYLASQVVMVFADAAARTSAIASPQEGMISYLKDTNSTQYYSGSAWATIGGSASGFTLVTSASFSASSAVNINNCFSATYENYKIIINYTGASTANDPRMRLRVSGTDASGSDYSWGSNGSRADGSAFQTPNTGTTYFDFGRATTTAQNSAWFEFNRPFEAAITTIRGVYAGKDGVSVYYNNLGGLHNVATSYDGFTIFPNTGTLTGNYYVYGYSN